VNAATWLSSSSQGLAILNDRSQGGSSLHDGELELMVHRRLTVDDGRGVGEPLNETGLDGRGLVITGIHQVLLADPTTLSTLLRTHQQRVYAPLHLSLAPLTGSVASYLATHSATFSALGTALPENIDIPTAYAQADGTILFRLQHNFGVGEASPLTTPVTVDLSTITSSKYPLCNPVEVSLTNNQSPSDIKRLKWNTVGDDDQNEKIEAPRRQRGVRPDATITVSPAEIRTFVAQTSGC